ncbi:Uu.00g001790.m01.CDS01 [Anthostomella pinea]|uniref:Uu.00g001790.m01.CDS01 n=1 Tax=Anthostomella pinea TaxID=933095 RepID=A0AAI8VJE8_9PEZI|nr:Uu.00g001790.m01.CDS01 [Anthostomella pinea]
MKLLARLQSQSLPYHPRDAFTVFHPQPFCAVFFSASSPAFRCPPPPPVACSAAFGLSIFALNICSTASESLERHFLEASELAEDPQPGQLHDFVLHCWSTLELDVQPAKSCYAMKHLGSPKSYLSFRPAVKGVDELCDQGPFRGDAMSDASGLIGILH